MDSRGALAALTALITLVALGSTAVEARAAADGGWLESNTNLAIRPELNDPFETTIASWKPLMFVDMPVAKVVQSVELGDLRSDPSCTTPVLADLVIEEHRDSEPYGTPHATTESTGPATLPMTPGNVRWTILPRTFEKGIGYVFKVRPRAGSCTTARYTTWAHSASAVVGGSNGCAADPVSGTASKRIWISAANPPACPVSNYDSSMPGGWLSTLPDPYQSGWVRINIYRTSGAGGPSPKTGCMDSWPTKRGGTWTLWRYNVTDQKYEWVCVWDYFLGIDVNASPSAKGWHYALPWLAEAWSTTRVGQPRDMHVTLETIDYSALIHAYKPQMNYAAGENYFADSAGSMTDWFLNKLIREDSLDVETTIADHDSGSEPPELTLDLLGATYANSGVAAAFGSPRADEDKLVQDSDPQWAANAMRNIGYGDRIYGRAVHGSDGKLWLQYWFWYYYNDLVVPGGEHEGDWEMIQVGLDANRNPDKVAYATHNEGDRCDFQTASISGVPQVYPARGSHASYWWAGTSDNFGPVDDDHWGDYPGSPQPVLEVVTGELSSFWGWPGRWGDNETYPDKSPPAPREQAKWSNPKGFYDGAAQCLSGARRRGARPRSRPAETRRLPVPMILAATRDATHATIRYSIPDGRRPKEPLYVDVSVRAQAGGDPAVTEVRRLRPGVHTVRVRLPLGGSPYRVTAQVVDRHSRYGRLAARTLR
ncbi:MAG: hypothetical protein M3340_14860 [Actinomycetota bacterium]|nr:hypothetical protein [Actinomycetota bacterium]